MICTKLNESEKKTYFLINWGYIFAGNDIIMTSFQNQNRKSYDLLRPIDIVLYRYVGDLVEWDTLFESVFRL